MCHSLYFWSLLICHRSVVLILSCNCFVIFFFFYNRVSNLYNCDGLIRETQTVSLFETIVLTCLNIYIYIRYAILRTFLFICYRFIISCNVSFFFFNYDFVLQFSNSLRPIFFVDK